MILIRFIFIGVCTLLPFSGAYAVEEEKLLASQVEAFIGTQKVLEPLATKMKSAGYATFFKPRPLSMANKRMPLYVQNVEILKKETPHFYNEMAKIVTTYLHEPADEDMEVYHFKSAEDWARIGDRVMLAHFSENSTSSRTGFDEMSKRFTPQMMAMMPPESKVQINGVLEMMRSLQNVSEYDRQVVKPYEEQLIGYLAEML